MFIYKLPQYAKPDNSYSHEFEHHRPSNKGTKLLLKVIKAIIIINTRYDRKCNTQHANRIPLCRGYVDFCQETMATSVA